MDLGCNYAKFMQLQNDKLVLAFCEYLLRLKLRKISLLGEGINIVNKEICDNIFKYISDDLECCIDAEVFDKTSFVDLGKYYYNKVLESVINATEELLQIVIRFMAGKKGSVENQDDYYNLLCQIIHIKKLPSHILAEVEKEYDEIFVQKYSMVVQKADISVLDINNELSALQSKADAIKNASPSHSLMKDLTNDELKLYEYCNKCNLLKTRKEMIEFAVQYMKSNLMKFSNINDISSIEIAKKREALKLSRNDTYGADFSFFSYRDVVEITEDDIDRPYALFYKIKLYTTIEKARKKLQESLYVSSDEERIEQYKTYVNKIPKIDDLHLQKENNQSEYLYSLKKFVVDYAILDSLNELMDESVCLRDRKEILKKCLELFKTGEYELFDNIAPIQIEGMFADFLRDTTTFRRFTKLETYDSAVLREKIKILQDINSDIYPEAVEYFMFYFNNVIRNKVAHGSYKTIFKDVMQAEIFATEVILDMSMLVYMLSRKSETEKMYRFISEYQKYYTKLVKSQNSCFGALLNDMIGDKTIAEYDSIERYRPIQVAYWLVNPYYEKIYEAIADKKELLDLRNQFLSKEFWEYVLETLNDIIKTGYDYKGISTEFHSIVKGLFRCNITDEVRVLLGQISAKLQIIKMMNR